MLSKHFEKIKIEYLLFLSFIFFIITSFLFLNISNEKTSSVKGYQSVAYYYLVPKLKSDFAQPPSFSSRSIYAVDVDSGYPLFEKNENEKLYPASTTKIITALVALDYYPLDKVLEVSDLRVEGQKMNLLKGEKITVKDLIFGLLIYSANDAAEVLANNYPGGRDNFIFDMNKKAKEINLNDTRFSNPSGLDNTNHYTTASDLVKASSHAVKNPFFLEVVSTKEKVVTSIDGKIVHNLENINKLVGEIDGVLGVKTGWTENAGENLVSYIEKDNKKIMIVLLGSNDRFGETEKLIGWIFENYYWDLERL